MSTNELTVMIAGEAGQGVESTGRGFVRAIVRGGLHVFGVQDYYSRIRGGHNFYQVRISENALHSHDERVHLLLAMNAAVIDRHLDEIVPDGGVIYDSALDVDEESLTARSLHAFPMPLEQIALAEGGSKIMSNTAAIAAAAGVMGFGQESIDSVIGDNFKKKGAQVVDANLKVARTAYQYAVDKYAALFPFKAQVRTAPTRMVIPSNDALALGAALAGCKFVAGYPMTPTTSILEWMAARSQDYGIVLKHAEDEIAAMNMVIGAGHMGVRAMTATSGGGFSLMVEALGLAGMTETPVVIVLGQRPGPSTGLATRHEQGDLLFALYASQGEFPRIVLAPGTVEQCFEAGWRSFNLAEKYQCPVIIITDTFLVHSLRDLEMDALDLNVPIERGDLLTDAQLDKLNERYKRHAFTDSGVSPRAIPGHPRAVYAVTSDEHDEYGQISEEASNRTQMMDKRMRKLEAAGAEMRGPIHYGVPDADLTFVVWGSAVAPLRSAVDILNANGQSAELYQIVDIWPFPSELIAAALKDAKKLVCVEQNYTGQMATLLRAYANVHVDGLITKYDGRPMSPEYILRRLKEVA